MAAAGTSNGPRYAPEDPTLPKPWKGLVDGSTGYLYYWNPVTNVTQYERPLAELLPPPPPPLPLPGPPPKSAVQVSAAHAVGSSRRDAHDDDGRHSGHRSHQHVSSRGGSSHALNGSSSARHESTGSHAHSSQSSKPSGRVHASDVGGGLSVEAYRRQHEITITGDNVPAPYMTFDSTKFPSEILREVHHAGFPSPTPIQAQSWPVALDGRDIVAIAKTGSGKTLGYLIPGFIHIKKLRNNPKVGPTVLVLSPTRELATQIQEEAVKFGRSSRISCACLYGGASKGPQLRDIERGVDVVVATPGRLNDFIEMRKVSLRQVSYLVLDEADRMLDMGFEPQILKIVKEVPSRRQTLMFTATWPREVRKIASDLLYNPVQVNIGNIDELVANKAITQYVEVVMPAEKQRRLEHILRSQEPGSKILVFCSTKRMCDQLARSLARHFSASAIHGDKSQSERDWVLNQFRSGKSPILVATDVAARGLDIKDIRVVINYDFPTGIEDYVHRIGRTGRAGASGLAYTFFSEQDSRYASDLIKILEGSSQHVPSKLKDMATRGRYGGGGRKSRRGWRSSGPSDVVRSLGGITSDSNHGVRDRQAQAPSSTRSDRDRGRSDRGRSPHDRHDHSNRGGLESDARGRYDSRGTAVDHKSGGGRGRSRSRSRSRSPYRGHHDERHNSRSVSRSRSRSRSRSVGQTTVRRQGGADMPPPCAQPLEQTKGGFQRDHDDHNVRSPQSPPSHEQHQPQWRSPAAYTDEAGGNGQMQHNSRSPPEQRAAYMDTDRDARDERSMSQEQMQRTPPRHHDISMSPEHRQASPPHHNISRSPEQMQRTPPRHHDISRSPEPMQRTRRQHHDISRSPEQMQQTPPPHRDISRSPEQMQQAPPRHHNIDANLDLASIPDVQTSPQNLEQEGRIPVEDAIGTDAVANVNRRSPGGAKVPDMTEG